MSNYSRCNADAPIDSETEGIVQSPEMPWARNSYWFYSTLVEPDTRDRLMSYLDQQGIETRPFFYPIHTLPPYRHGLKLPVAERLSAMGLNLPSSPNIGNDELQHVASTVRDALQLSRESRQRGGSPVTFASLRGLSWSLRWERTTGR